MADEIYIYFNFWIKKLSACYVQDYSPIYNSMYQTGGQIFK